jgi:hypothetical protein
VAALIVVAAVDALRSQDDEAAATATEAATTPAFSATTTVAMVVDDEAADNNNFVLNQDPKDLVDETGDPLPDCSQDELRVSIPPFHNREGDGFFGLLLVRGPDDCRQAYPYFRVAARDSRGHQLLVWTGRLLYAADPAPSDPTYADLGAIPCQRWEVFPASVTVGYERSPEGQVFRLGMRCD